VRNKERHRKRYTVEGSMKNFTLARAGASITLAIHSSGELVGTAEIGRGSIMWRNANGKRRKRITWEKFAAWAGETEG
jgi:hypothetical protein